MEQPRTPWHKAAHLFKVYGPAKLLRFGWIELHRKLILQPFYHSYSQEGEDLALDRLLKNQAKGFFVDIGAFDPVRLSNTKRFSDRGWTGINVEPDTTNYKKFVAQRPRDINLNIGIADKNGEMTFYEFFPPTLSTFAEDMAKDYQKLGYKLVAKHKVPVMRLDKVLAEQAKDKTIDFMSVDTEALDLEVLKSNDWKKFRPRLVCIEATDFETGVSERKNNAQVEFLESVGYKELDNTGSNAIFGDTKLKW